MRVIVVSSDPDELPDAEARLDARDPRRRRRRRERGHRPARLRRRRAATRRASSWACCCRTPRSSPGGPEAAPAVPGESALGRIAQRRITDASTAARPAGIRSTALARSYTPGDTDFAWTRLTLWRAQLAAVLDQPPYEPITGVQVTGAIDSPSTTLLAAWLRLQLDAPTTYELTPVDARFARHPRRAPRARRPAPSSSCATSPASRRCASRASRARRRAPPPQPPRLPRRRTAPPRPR